MDNAVIAYSALTISGLAIIVAIVSALIAEKARKEVKVQALFSGFQQANQATIENIDFLKDVHGLEGLTEGEYKNIAYLSILMDAFQHEGVEHDETTFLDNIISIPKNKQRWTIMKDIYYGNYDKKFVSYIDKKFESIEHN